MARGGILEGAPADPEMPASFAATAMRMAERSGLGPILRRLPMWRGVLGLTYHRIGDGRRSLLDRELWSATAEQLDAEVASLSRSCDLVGPPDLPELMSRGRGRHVMITFDDGYLDNWELALPILRAHGARATFFLSTGFLDVPRLPWWDEIAWMVRVSPRHELAPGAPLAQRVAFDDGEDRHTAVRLLLDRFKTLRGEDTEAFLDALAESTASGRAPAQAADRLWMSWDMARDLREQGMWIGGHTVNHPVLARLSHADQAAEIEGCARRLREELGQEMAYFSYPVGVASSFNSDTRDCLQRCGVQLAFAYHGGYQRFGASARFDRHAIPRATVGWYMSPDRVTASAMLPQLFARW